MATNYLLALTDTEMQRYRRMAEMAHQDEGELWRTAGIVPGAVVADIGFGPGAVTVELADIVGRSGAVVAVDADPRRPDRGQRDRGQTRVRERHCSPRRSECHRH
jgi:tRNA A58 N-methylase Trm61